MNLYETTIVYTVSNGKEAIGTLTEQFWVSAQNKQYVKEAYHRYTHENYQSVDRSLEDVHAHPLSDGVVEHQLRDITEINQIGKGKKHIRYL